MVGWLRGAVVTLLVVGLVALNILTVTVESVFSTVSAIAETAALGSVASRREGRLVAAERRLADLRRERDGLGARAARLGEERDMLRRDNEALLRERDDLRRERDRLRTERDRHRRRATRLAQARERAQGLVAGVTARIGRRTGIGATRNVASIWAEALPYVGAGTILAVTAAEIYDACETLKDVEELRRGFDLEPSADGTSMKVCGLGLPSEFELGTSREDGIEADYRDCMRAAGLRRGKERECEAEKRRRLEKARNTLAHCLVNAGPSRAMKERCLERHASGELR